MINRMLGPTGSETTGTYLRLAVERACRRSAELQGRARELVESSRTLRAARQLASSRPGIPSAHLGFRFAGLVDDDEVRAEWTTDGLVADEALMRRASLVVGMGDTFERPDGTTVTASLDQDPVAALLTLVRAADRSLEVSISVRSEDPHLTLSSGSRPARQETRP